jgi:DNA polymerase (family 10)
MAELGAIGNVTEYMSGPSKTSAFFTWRRRTVKIDVFVTTRDQHAFALLYLTGSKEHNIVMRATAKRRRMLLNQFGLFRDGATTTERATTERAIFRLLNMPYKEPHEREAVLGRR